MNLDKNKEKLIIDYILGITETIPEDLKMEAENYYFACCLLMPTESVINRVEELGGFSAVLNNLHFMLYLANFYRVPLNTVRVRLISLQQSILEEENKNGKKVYEKDK